MSALYFIIYSAFGISGTYIPLYYSNARGFSPIEIGYILSAAPLVSIVAQLFWGNIADMVKSKNILLSVMFLILCVFVGLLPLGKIFVLALVLQCLFAFMESPAYSLVDTICTENCSKMGLVFGKIRLAGTIGYGLVGLLSGYIINQNIFLMFPAYIILMLSAQLPIRTMPTVSGHRQTKAKVNPFSILKNKRLCFIYALCFMTAIPMAFLFSFFPIYYTSDAVSGATWHIGVYLLISVAVEVPILFFYDKLRKRFGVEKIMIASVFLLALRFVLVGLFKSPLVLLSSSFLQSAYVTLFVGTALFINENVDPGLRATGQSISGLLMAGVAKIIASFSAGHLVTALGYAATFLYSGIFLALIVVAAAVFFRFSGGVTSEA